MLWERYGLSVLLEWVAGNDKEGDVKDKGYYLCLCWITTCLGFEQTAEAEVIEINIESYLKRQFEHLRGSEYAIPK